MTDLKSIAATVVQKARQSGASAADAFINEDDTFSVLVRMGEVETLKQAISRSLRLRVFIGKRTASLQTSEMTESVLSRLVEETIQMARVTSEDESGGLPDREIFRKEIPDLDLFDPAWDDLSTEDRIELARRCEATALSADRAITNSEGGSFDYSRSRVVLANSEGFTGDYTGTFGSISAAPIAQSAGGMQRDFWTSSVRHRKNLASPEEVGRIAAARAVRRLDARKVKTCEAPVIFDPLTARSLVSHVLNAVSGDAVYRQASFLSSKLGQVVASPQVEIVDDALMKGGLGSGPFDDEGVPTQTTPIVERGVLSNYLHSAYTARRLGARPTGNGSRSGMGSVAVGPTNFFLKAGTQSPEEIISSVKRGLYVVELIGFGFNAVNGDYSRGAMGLWIEDGKLAFPVHEVTIAGNLSRMLQDIDAIGNDLTFLGSVAAPTLRVRNMVIGGE